MRDQALESDLGRIRPISGILNLPEMEPQSLDTLWLLVCAGLVFLMQPGFLCLESGLTRSKSAVNVALKNLADFGLSVALFWTFGYGLVFGATLAGWLGRGSWFPAIGDLGAWPAAFFVFHALLCGTAVTIVSGAVAERLRFGGYLLITLLGSGPIYTVFAHWAWNGLDTGALTGWLGELGFRDFAGATVVHGAGGWLALAAVLALGPRRDRFPTGEAPRDIPGHNLPVALLGAFLLWLGWLGFNGGSAGWSDRVPAIVANTVLAGAGGMLSALLAGQLLHGRPAVKQILNGTLAGLVSITAACQVVGSTAAVGIGAGGGLVMLAAAWLLERYRIDDVVGAVPVHAAAGVWGTLAVAIFGDLQLLGTGLGRGEQLAAQALGALVCCLWAFGGGYLTLRLIDRAIGLRVSPEEELQGLNVVEHGATTELLQLVTAMEKQAESSDLSQRVDIAPGTEVGEIAAQYNRVIDALQRAMEDVQLSAERYRRTIDNALDAIVTVDRYGVILGWNPRAAAIFGWTREEALGEDVFELVTRPQDRDNTRTGLLSFLTTGGESTLLGQRLELTGVHRDGRELPIEATFTMAALGDRPEFNLFFQDITARRRARRALQQAKEAAEAATRAKSEFLANMSHEIRTPMNGIIGIIELMLDAGPSRRQRRYLEMIRVSADSLLRLLDDVLNYSKFETGKIELQAVDFALRNHLVDLLGALAIQARKKGLRLVCRVEPEVPDRLIGDPVRLGQVIINLVSNGIKFTPEGEVAVDVALIAQARERAVLEFVVTDTGPGIPVDKQVAIFHPFEQAAATPAQRYAGAGLGLAICKSLVESMGGHIGIDGKPSPGGSTFRFTCPFGLLEAPAGEAGDVPSEGEARDVPRELPLLDFDETDEIDRDDLETGEPPAASREPELGPGRVLVVEDNRINQVVAEGLLEGWGLDTEIASSGTEALAALERGTFDLVLTDMRMPDMDGFAVTAAIRQRERSEVLARVPIIAMTANVAPGDRQKCLDAGMDGYVAKPIHKPALLAAVRGALYPGVTASSATASSATASSATASSASATSATASSASAASASATSASEPGATAASAPQSDIPDQPATGESTTPEVATATSASATSASPAVPFDRETLLRRVAGRRERAATLAEIFLEEDAPHHRAALAEAFAERDVPAIRDAAHGLRGAAGEICAPAVTAAAEQLEAATEEQDLRRIEKKYETLDREIQKLTQHLEAFLRE